MTDFAPVLVIYCYVAGYTPNLAAYTNKHLSPTDSVGQNARAA